MKLEQQVVSLELAQKLKELGVKQESLFWHRRSVITYPAGNTNTRWEIGFGKMRNTDPYERFYEKDFASAFTVAELGEMLPMMYQPIKDESNGKWLYIKVGGKTDEPHKNWADTEADARAKMLVYLLENSLLPTN